MTANHWTYAVAAFLALALAVPSAARADGDYGRFRSVIAFGQGQSVTPADFAAYQASGSPPASFMNQFDMYTGIVRAAPSLTAGDLDRFYKNSGFDTARGGDLGAQHPRKGVTIMRDSSFRVPRVYGDTRSDVMFGAGYASAQDRLFQMDLARRTARASTVELLGAGAAAADSRTLGYQDFSGEELDAQFDDLGRVAGADGAQVRQDVIDYIAGINAYIDEVKNDPTRLPAEYTGLGASPERWTVADTVALANWMVGETTVTGGLRELRQAEILQTLIKRFGNRRARRVFDDLRRGEDPEEPTITRRRFVSDRPGPVNRRALALPDIGSQRPRNAVVGQPAAGGRKAVSTAALPAWAQALAANPLELPDHMSNAVLVSGRHSKSGHPLASMGPQTGYFSPSLLLELELHGGGIDISGVVFPGSSPYPLIGHGPDFAWSGTSAQADNADIFAERLCEPDGSAPSYESRHYIFKGACRPFISREQTMQTPVAPVDPRPPQTVKLRTLRSVHGTVVRYATVDGEPVALTWLQAPDGHIVQSWVPFMRLAEGRVHDARSFVATMRLFTGGENWFYVDDREIGWIQSGWYPRRAKGTDPNFPTWGTGGFEWQGYEPRGRAFRRLPAARNPRAIEPGRGFLVDWNGKAAPGWDAWPWWGSVQRTQLLERPVAAALRRGKLDLATLTRITANAATADLRGQEVYPWLRRAIGRRADAKTRELLDLLSKWQRRGAHRRDLDGDNVYEDSAAVLLMDEWWPRLVRGMFEPKLGRAAMTVIDKEINPINPPVHENFFFTGWESQIHRELRTILGARRRTGSLDGRYCRGGSRRRCAAMLVQTLQAADKALQAELGTDRSHWQVSATCPGSERPAHCDQIEPTPLGAVSTPPIPFHNRGAFHQVVELHGHRPR